MLLRFLFQLDNYLLQLTFFHIDVNEPRRSSGRKRFDLVWTCGNSEPPCKPTKLLAGADQLTVEIDRGVGRRNLQLKCARGSGSGPRR